MQRCECSYRSLITVHCSPFTEMPELPEVETTRRGLVPLLVGQRVRGVVIRNRALRQPVPRGLPQVMAGVTIAGVARRGKYLLFDCGSGTLVGPPGMSRRPRGIKER